MFSRRPHVRHFIQLEFHSLNLQRWMVQWPHGGGRAIAPPTKFFLAYRKKICLKNFLLNMQHLGLKIFHSGGIYVKI